MNEQKEELPRTRSDISNVEAEAILLGSIRISVMNALDHCKLLFFIIFYRIFNVENNYGKMFHSKFDVKGICGRIFGLANPCLVISQS